MVLEQRTRDRLSDLRLDGMIAALADTGSQSAASARPFEKRLAQLALLDGLVPYDLAIAPFAAQARQDLLELLDDRVGSPSTLITSQLPASTWLQWLNEPIIADAIRGRLLRGSYTPALKGESLRRARPQA